MFYWSTEIINQASSNEYDQIKQKNEKGKQKLYVIAIGIYPSKPKSFDLLSLFINKQFI